MFIYKMALYGITGYDRSMVSRPSWLGGKKRVKEGTSTTTGTESGEKTGEEGIKCYQVKQFWNRKWGKVEEDFTSKIEPKDLDGMLEAGRYRIDAVMIGGGFKVIETFQVPDEKGEIPIGDAVEKKVKEEGEDDIDKFINGVDKLIEKKEHLDETLIKLHTLFGGGTTDKPQGTLRDMLKAEYTDFQSLAGIFGYTKGGVRTSAFDGIPVEGKFPAWAIYGPEILDKYMERIEGRLEKWGILENNTGQNESKEVKSRVNERLPHIDIEDIPTVDTDEIEKNIFTVPEKDSTLAGPEGVKKLDGPSPEGDKKT